MIMMMTMTMMTIIFEGGGCLGRCLCMQMLDPNDEYNDNEYNDDARH